MRKQENQKTVTALTTEAAQATAQAIGLRYVSDVASGIRRLRSGKRFRYVNPDKTPLRDPQTLDRIRALAIPPAWTDVWISPSANGHIQATGRDAKGRKQYRYHARWRSVRDETKYERLIAFGQALPRIRQQIEQDLQRTGLPREKVLATVIQLLETTHIRVGNEEYARLNGSHGLTTLRNKHVKIDGATMRFQFRGKSGVRHAIDLSDRRLAKIVKRCQALPGQELFQYLDDENQPQSIGSSDVNEYLRSIVDEDFTAKDFRTWAGTLLATTTLQSFKTSKSLTESKKNLLRAIESVAAQLGNTPAVCRKAYIHPVILERYLEGSLTTLLQQCTRQKLKNSSRYLHSHEKALLFTLQECAKEKIKS
jgi:DNA topoisomerase I